MTRTWSLLCWLRLHHWTTDAGLPGLNVQVCSRCPAVR